MFTLEVFYHFSTFNILSILLALFSDIFLITGFGLIEPILAIFIKEDLVGGTILTVGLASTLFLITKSIVQLPFSRYIDSHKDKMKWLVAGTFMVAFVPFIYIFAESINFFYRLLRKISSWILVKKSGNFV